jgi:hypothetical protein
MVPIYQRERVVRAQCKNCNEVFYIARNSGNSHMRRHLNLCEPRLKMHAVVEKLQSSVLSVDTVVLINWKFDKIPTRSELVWFLVFHELPFSLVEYDVFRNPLAELVLRN